MLVDFALIGLMILLNGIFVVAEMAVIAAQPTRLRAMVERGEMSAARLLAIRENPGDFLATIQIGITLAGTSDAIQAIGPTEADGAYQGEVQLPDGIQVRVWAEKEGMTFDPAYHQFFHQASPDNQQLDFLQVGVAREDTKK